MARANELFAQIKTALETRKGAASNANLQLKYDAALQALATLVAVDARARTSVGQEDRLHAGDLIYIDAQSQRETLTAELAAIGSMEDQAASQRIGRWTAYRMAMNGVAIVLVVLIALYLGRALSIVSEAPRTTTAQMLRDLPPPVKPAGVLSISPPASVAQAAPAPAPRSPVSLATTADLCVDLARVLDGRDIPALLERAASLLDAKGIMIWSIDTGGAMLRPTMCHGYSERVMAKLRPLQVDADNVTSLAFRTMQAQSLPGAAATDAGAIAVPLITSSGCVGVLAAEVRQSKLHSDLIPAARIVAAQFATLVAPVDDPAHKTAQG
jgi:hypothetical protein